MKQNKKYDILIFDFDGTLFDTSKDIVAAVEYVLSEYNAPIPPEETIVNSIFGPAEQFLAKLLGPGKESKIYLDAANMFHKYYEEHCDELTIPYEGVKETLEKLKGMGKTLVIATSKVHIPTIKILKKYSFLKYFDGIFADDDVPHPKPAPDCILLPLGKFSFSPNQALFIGDTVIDRETGRAANVDVCSVCYGFNSRFELLKSSPEYLVNRIEEVLQIVK